MKYLAITAILCLILAGASFAGNVTMTEVLTGGDLTLTMPENFSLTSVTIGGAMYNNATGNATYTVEDSRGSGAGWNLLLTGSGFKTAGTPQRTLIAGVSQTVYLNMTIMQQNITGVYGQSVDNTNGPKSLIYGGSAIGVFSVEAVYSLADYGMGKYNMLASHTLQVHAQNYAGSYTATLTATLNAVP